MLTTDFFSEINLMDGWMGRCSPASMCVADRVYADLLPVSSSGAGKPPALAVKRINWEKLDRVDENTVWAKVSPLILTRSLNPSILGPRTRLSCLHFLTFLPFYVA